MLFIAVWAVTVSLGSLCVQSSEDVDNHLIRLRDGGRVRGIWLTSEKGNRFAAFRGIPYAEPPVGHLRFKPPVPKQAGESSDIFDATKDGSPCPQKRQDNVIGTEDCLILNVYTPKLPTNGTNRTSVMIWVHGGGFMGGSGLYENYPPERLMDSDIVLVTINYRLGPLGFLSTSDAASPGNYGLLDQSLAFQWVKNNIEAFGGNPNSTTIFGESTGGSSMAYHLISSKSKGLFHRAIAMSGTDLSTYVFESNPLRWAKKLALQTECPENDTSAMVECLRSIPFNDLILAMEPYATYSTFLNILFPPTVDGDFLTAAPREILKNFPEKITNVPVMYGYTEMEGAGIVSSMKQLKPNISITSQEAYDYLFNNTIGHHDTNISRMIREHYLASVDVTNELEAGKAIAKAFSDGTVVMKQREEVQYLTNAGLDVFVYSYDYATVHTFGPTGAEDRKYGIKHAEDLHTLFNFTGFGPLRFEEDDYKMVDIMTSVWSSFAKTGYPDPTNKYLPQWKPSSADLVHIHHLNLSITIEDYDIVNDDLFKFWTEIEAGQNRSVEI